MPENILVVEYEPRYTDRVRQALAGQPFSPSFARDGEEAIRALENQAPRLIVLSSVVPKISTPELIRAIRGRNGLAQTPILLTVSGYNGKSPRQDAMRLGASDILPKPYSESEFLGKVQQMLGIRADAAGSKGWAPELDPEFTARPALPSEGEGHLTSNEIFGELLDDHSAAPAGARKPMKPKDDLDKMLADTLAGVMPQKKKDAAPPVSPVTAAIPKPTISAPTPAPPRSAAAPAAPAAVDPRAKTQAGTTSYDKQLNDTLSGLEKTARRPNAPAAPTVATPAPRPAAGPPPAAAKPAAAPAAAYKTDRIPVVVIPEKVPVSQPVLAKAPEPVPEEEEPTDGIKFGQYVLVDKIATGGMAEVWKARMRGVEGFQKIVAIKKILPHLSDNQDFIEMFVDEAKLAAQLNHNNIIHIYDLGKIQSSYYIAMEYIDGHDLKTILRRGEERDQPMSVELALFVASKIASALDYAHRKHDFEGKDLGLVHRDVSPQNVLVSQDGDIKLCDFGIAKAASKASHTQAGALKGKLQYMSPEQAWGRSIDKRSDIFALATVLFEMLTGKKLFTGDNELSILEQVREARVALPSEINDEVTPQIDRIVVKALQKDPANRYQTAGEMAKELDAVLYTFKPTPTSADLAIYMHRIWSPEPEMHQMQQAAPAPVVEAKPAPPPPPVAPVVAPPAPAVSVPSFIPADEAPAKKAPVVPIAIAAVVVLAAVGGYFAMRGGKGSTGPATAGKPAVSTTAPSKTATSSPTTPANTAAAPVASGTQAPVLDPAKINEEVQKRLAAERAKLDQTRAQQTPTAAPVTTSAAPPRPAPAPAVAAAAPAPTPAPVTPAPVPVTPVPVPVAETRPAPQPAAAEPAPAARAQVGDLVPSGTPGLAPAHMARQAPAPYPPMAKAQRVEGSVVMSVLVSETGQVLETRILSGVNRPVGINEAAEQSIRRSGFTPGTKDGVRVKSWTTVRIDFKL
jgi:TonB family protein